MTILPCVNNCFAEHRGGVAMGTQCRTPATTGKDGEDFPTSSISSLSLSTPTSSSPQSRGCPSEIEPQAWDCSFCPFHQNLSVWCCLSNCELSQAKVFIDWSSDSSQLIDAFWLGLSLPIPLIFIVHALCGLISILYPEDWWMGKPGLEPGKLTIDQRLFPWNYTLLSQSLGSA